MTHVPTPHDLSIRARVYGLLILYGLLASLIFSNKAQADDTARLMAEPNGECMAFAEATVPQLHALVTSNVPPALVRHLILIADDAGDAGRWLLITTLDAMELTAAHGKRMSQSDAMDFAALLCRYPVPGKVSAPYRGEFAPRHTEI